MKIETRTRTIPAQEVQDIIYIACDGTEFNNKYLCMNHEIQLPLKERPVIKNKIEKAITVDGYFAELYLIQSNDDLEAIYSLYHLDPLHTENDYEKYGSGWYILYSLGGDGEYYLLLNYSNYIQEYKNELENVIKSNQKAIDEAIERWQ